MSLKPKTLHSLFWSAVYNWGSQAGSLIVFFIIARLLTPDAFGLLALANVFINFMFILSFLSSRSDNLLISYYFGEKALRYYAIAQRILQVIFQLIAVSSYEVALSTFSRLQVELLRFRQVFYQAAQVLGLIVFYIFLSVSVLAPELVVVLFSEQWQPSIPILQVLSFAEILRSLSALNESVLTALGKPDWRLRIGLLNSFLIVITCLVTVHRGMIAVSIAYVTSNFLTFPVSLWAINKLIQVPLFRYLQQFIINTVATTIRVLAILITKYFLEGFNNVLLILVINITVGIITLSLTIQLLVPAMWLTLIDFVYNRKLYVLRKNFTWKALSC